MLKGVPKILSPQLLKVLCEMGHSDRIVIADGNFPAESMGKDAIVIRMDGHGVPEILDAVLQVFPLDSYVEKPFSLMEVMPGMMWKRLSGILMKRLRRNMSPGEKRPSAISNGLLFMKKRRRRMPLLQPEKRRFMPM